MQSAVADLPEVLAAHTEWLATGGTKVGRANLSEVSLSGADLSGADLCGVNLRDASIDGADLDGVVGVAVARPVGSSGRMIYAVDHGDQIMIHAGCWWGSVDELRARIALGGDHGWHPDIEDRNRSDYEAALAWLVHRIESGSES